MGEYMKKLTNKKILNIFTLCIIIGVPFVLNISFYLQVYNVIKSYSSMNPSIVIWFCIPFLFFVYIKDIIDKKRKLDIYDFIFYLLIITGFIVSIFAINKKISIIGVEYRHEGFLSLLGYYLLFINWKVNGTLEDLKKYIKIFVVVAIINSIYALFQIYLPSFKLVLKYSIDRNMASGICGNPNFYGSLIVMILSIVTCKHLIEEDTKPREIILLILFIISLINSQSTGPILTYILTIIFITIVLKIKKRINLEKIVILVLMIILSYITSYSLSRIDLNLFNSNHYSNEVKDIRCELCDFKETIDTGGNGRLEIWENTIDVIKKYPIFGVGYDNLEFAYPNSKTQVHFYVTNNHVEKITTGIDVYIDNAHNVYLHTLATSGIVGLFLILILLFYTFIHGLKSNNKYMLMLLSGFVAYSIQAFANISVIQVAPIYYTIIGLILSESFNKDRSLT